MDDDDTLSPCTPLLIENWCATDLHLSGNTCTSNRWHKQADQYRHNNIDQTRLIQVTDITWSSKHADRTRLDRPQRRQPWAEEEERRGNANANRNSKMNGIKRTKIPRPLKYPSVRLKCWVGIAGCKNTHHPAEDVASFTARQQKSTIHVIPEKTESTNPLKKHNPRHPKNRNYESTIGVW